MWKLNTTPDHAVMRSVARGYVKAVPSPVRTGISNFLSNLSYMKGRGTTSRVSRSMRTAATNENARRSIDFSGHQLHAPLLSLSIAVEVAA